MQRLIATALALAAGGVFTQAAAQYSARVPVHKRPSVTTPALPGGYSSADDCAAPHTFIGSGDLLGVPFTTGTTGGTGQNEAACYAFGTSGIDQDVWFDWTATQNGQARMRTCGWTGVDTRVAVWPDHSPASCPPDGASLACNDDACGLQSSVTWPVVAGATYTLQLGTFPGAAGGSGTFDVTIMPPFVCGQHDDGTSENALGLNAGGEIGWLHRFTCLWETQTVETAYGSPLFPGSVTNGSISRAAVYADLDDDGDPSTAAELRGATTTVVVNGDTDIFNPIWLDRCAHLTLGQGSFVMVTADHAPGEFPAPMDQDDPTPEAWVVGSTSGPGSLDLADLSNNDVPPLCMSAIGFPTAWLLRSTPGCWVPPPWPVCFGDGSGAPCGCGNEVPGTMGGCANGLGLSAMLIAHGLADVTDDTLTLICHDVPARPGLFFQGNNQIAGGLGVTFGDGIRCCGQDVVRLEVVHPPGPEPATATTSVTISEQGAPGTITFGVTKCYQYWYRDPWLGPCGSTYNLSNGLSVTWY